MNKIDISMVIDTDAIKRTYQPSKDPKKPTPIPGNMCYMFATGTTVMSGQGTGALNIKVLVGDTVRAFAACENFEDSVLIYDMPRDSGDQVFAPFHSQDVTKWTAAPNSDEQVLPARILKGDCWFYETSVVTRGTENYRVQFALYTPASESGQPALFGYYYWSGPTITVLS